MSEPSRLVHIVDDVEALDDASRASPSWSCSPASSTPASPPSSPPGTSGRCRRAGSWRPSTSTRCTTTAPVARPSPSSATTTTTTRRPGWSSGALRDTGGTPFLLLRGPEPDIRWEGFARAVREVVERFDVRRVVSLGAVPMAVPHTRPIAITPHANRPELLTGPEPVARRAARAVQRPVAARDPARGVGPRRAGLRRAHPALPRADGVPAGRDRAARAARDRRPPHHRPHRGARGRGDHRDRDRPLPRVARRGGRGRARPRAPVRRVPRRRGVRQLPARRGPADADRRGDRAAVRAVPGRPRRRERARS